MRLWHKKLINALPKQQLLGQIRELTEICVEIKENGKTNHILINRVMNFPLKHLYTYCKLVEKVAKRENINIKEETLNKWYGLFEGRNVEEIEFEELFKSWHNSKYLTQCYYNLEEKWYCGGITDSEFNIIRRIFINEK